MDEFGGMLYFMPEGQFYAKRFSAWTGLDPRRGWCCRYGVAASLLARIPHNDGTTAPTRERKPVHAYFPIISIVELETKTKKTFKIFPSCLSRPSWSVPRSPHATFNKRQQQESAGRLVNLSVIIVFRRISASFFYKYPTFCH